LLDKQTPHLVSNVTNTLHDVLSFPPHYRYLVYVIIVPFFCWQGDGLKNIRL